MKKYSGNIDSKSSGDGERGGVDRFGRRAFRAEYYRPDPGLVDAVNTALLLNMPLLLTGEPGVGKSRLADSVSAELGLGEPLKFFAKSISSSRDLYYLYDTIAHFRASQTRRDDQEVSAAEFLRLSALGTAIVKTHPPDRPPLRLPNLDAWETQRSVVLIDEIDKAPRDFPNDILNELEDLFFEIPEMSAGDSGVVRVDAVRDPELFPIVIITSNSEKDLPDAFMRRCVFYHIPFPDDGGRLGEIVEAHTGLLSDAQQQLEADALAVFLKFREHRNWQKAPSPAELLDWIFVMSREAGGEDVSLREKPEAGRVALTTLFKNKTDLDQGITVFDEWAGAGEEKARQQSS